MIGLLKKSAQYLSAGAVAALAPVIAWRHAEARWQRGLVAAVHVAAVLLILAGLILIQRECALDTLVRSSLPVVRACWLPLVGLLAYVSAWTAWFVAKTLRSPQENPVPDNVSTALRSGFDRLAQAGIDVTGTPLYLVLGSPRGGLRDFFAASRTDLLVSPAAEETGEPIAVCGNRDAVYVWCREVSLLDDYTRRAAEARAEQLRRTADGARTASRAPAHAGWSGFRGGSTVAGSGSGAANAPTVPGTVPGTDRSESPSAVATLDPGADGESDNPVAHGQQQPLERLHETIDQLESLTESEPQTQAPQVLQPQLAKPKMLRLESLEAANLLQRLDSLCREIAELREPFCPINGTLLLVPLDATDSSEIADHVGMRIERDLQTIAVATESRVSSQVIFCDLEETEGGQPFLDRFPDAQRHRRLGATLPAPPASEPDAGPQGVDRAVEWICNQLFPPLGYRLMKRAADEPTLDRMMQTDNHGIRRLTDRMRKRREGMSRMLRRVVASDSDTARIRGCFVTATGSAGQSKQAFAEGVMPLVLDMQNEVQWSEARRARDRWQRRAAAATYVAVTAATSATLPLVLGWHR